MSEPEPTPLEVAQRVFDGQAFSKLIGASLRSFGDGVAVLEVPYRPELLQQLGFLHGGVVAYAIDNSISFAAGTVLGTNILTAGLSIVYLRPAGAAITATATVMGRTRRQAVVQCEVHTTDADGKDVLVATGQGTATTIDR